MPSASKKNLYLSSSVGGLNKLAEVKLERGISLKSYCNSATKLYKAALEHSLLGDEEKAYVLYMKYFNIYGHIRKSKDFKKDESYYAKLMGSANAKKAIEEAEKLSKSLNERYDLKADAEKAKKVAEELEVLRDGSGKDDKVTLSPSDDVGSFFPYVPVDKLSSSGVYNLLKVGEKKTPLSPEKPNEPDEITKALEKSVSVIRETKPGFISAEQLYNMFQDRDTSFLIMDVRPQDQYSSSHIKHGASINIPAEVVKPGTTVSVIERGLPEDTRTQWDRRGQVDHIILVDWEGGAEDLAVGSTLQSLKDAMFKWDSVTIIKSEPLVLEGGFDNWLFTYPMYTTNPSVPRPPAYTQQQQHGIISFDFDYPTLDDEKEEEPEVQVQKKDERASPIGVTEPSPALTANQNGSAVGPVSVPQVDVVQQPKDIPKPSPPVVNRATKPLVKVPPSSPKHQKPTPTVNGTAGQGGTDDSLVEGSKPSQLAPTQPSFPQVDRSTKPKISLNRTSESDKPSGPSEAELRISELAKIGLEKLEAERRKIEEERQRIEEEKKKLEVERLNHMRNMQEKEDEKKQELERIEEEKRARDRQLEKLRKQKQEKLRQQQEAEEKREEELEKERQKQERERQLKEEEEEKKLQELEDRKKREADKKAQQEKEESERAQKLKEEQEKLSREKAEKARQEEIARAEKEREERLRQETARREREEQERQERIKKQQERDKEFARLEADKSSAGSKNPVTSPGLPVGWEKVLDQQTGRYYYKDHNTATTHWNLPQSILNRSPGSGSGTYKVSLQDEPQGKGKLRRSHSSPNIAQMVADELAETKKIPKVDRKGKPEIVRAPKVRPESAEVQAARLRNMQPVFGGQGRGLTGLRNLGNTCYMNSIIQSLCSATLLSEYFLKETYKFDINRENKLGCNGEIAEEFAAIIKALWSGQYRSVAPRDFKCSVGKYNSQFANFNQQDSQEFLLFLMDGLHEDMNRVKNREYIQDEDMGHLPDVTLAERAWQNHKRLNQSIIVELFQGQFKSTLECLRCKKTSTTFEAFMYLSLPIPSSGRCKLQDCVQTFTKPEKVSGSDKWYCSRCKTHREAVKKIEIWKLPPFLLIHLKRFKYEGVWRQKLNTNVDFPLSSFDMRSFIVGPKPQPHYKLFAVSNHYGTMEGGHYTAFCKNTGNRKWYKFDDHEVNELSTSSVQSSAAYILFYSAMELQPPNQTSF